MTMFCFGFWQLHNVNLSVMNLTEYEVKACPSTIYYVPNFISREEETQILHAVSRAPKPKWTQLSNRRLLNYGGIPHPKGMVAETIPQWLDQFVERVNRLDVFEPGTKANHVLVNEYLPGQGIMPHLDGPLFYPTITTISCGSHTVLEYFEQMETEPTKTVGKAGGALVRHCVARLLIEPRSLLVVKNDMYHRYLHGIQEQDHDVIDDRIVNLVTAEADGGTKIGDVLPRSTRLSLTIRHVPKTTKMKIKLF